MSARTQVYCRSYLRRGHCGDAQIAFRYREMGRVDNRPKNHRSNGANAHEIGAAGNPLRQIRARIYSRNEKRSSTLCELAAASGKAPDRKSRRAAPRTDGLESKNKKHLAALSRRAAHLLANSVLPELILSRRRVPENFHRGGGGRNCGEPCARLRDGGASLHHVAHLLHGFRGRLLCYGQDHVLARIRICRCAKCEHEHDTCTSNRPAACATEPASCFHALILPPFRIFASLFQAASGQKNDPFGHPKSIRPKKMFQTQMVETRFCFFAPTPLGGHQFFVDGSSRFPL